MTFCDAGALLFSTPRHIAAFAPHSHPITVDFSTPTGCIDIIGIVIIGITGHRHLPFHLVWQSPLSSSRTSSSPVVANHHHRPHHWRSTSLLLQTLRQHCSLLLRLLLIALCSCSLLAAAVTYCICWAHPTLAPTVLTVTALLQLLLKLLLRSWLH